MKRQWLDRWRTPAQGSESVPGTAVSGPRPVILVTGGTGFLGQHLVRQLVELGSGSVRVLSTAPPRWLEELGVHPIAGSITDREDVARAVDGVTEIYHLAGRVSRDPKDARELHHVHVEGTRILCDAAVAAGVRSMVLASSSGTIAVSRDPVALDERTTPPLDLILRWPYYASKLYQERVALERFAGEGRRLVIVNPSLLFGPGDERLSSTKLVLDFMGRRIPMVPGGGLSLVDARDTARACRAAMRLGRSGERYLLGSANWTFRELFDRLGRLTKTTAPRMTVPGRFAAPGARAVAAVFKGWKLASPVDPVEVELAGYYWYLDAGKAERELGFSPRDPGETLADTVGYVRERFGVREAAGR